MTELFQYLVLQSVLQLPPLLFSPAQCMFCPFARGNLCQKLRDDGAMKCCLSTLPISDEDREPA